MYTRDGAHLIQHHIWSRNRQELDIMKDTNVYSYTLYLTVL